MTAAVQGSGRAIAERLVQEGARAVATDLRADRGLTCGPHALDVPVTCAGFVHHGSVPECGQDGWDFSVDQSACTVRATPLHRLDRGGGGVNGAPKCSVDGANTAAEFATPGERAQVVAVDGEG